MYRRSRIFQEFFPLFVRSVSLFTLGLPLPPLIPFLYLAIRLGTTPFHLHTRSALVFNPLAWPWPKEDTCPMQF
jgi:hypothetical protein